MSFAAIAVIVCAATIIAGLAATHPVELRENRWLKISLSLPLTVLVASVFYELEGIRGYFAMWSIGILAFIWKSPIAHLFTHGFAKLVYGDWNRPTGIRAEFGGAKALFKRGDLEDALRLTLQELEKEPMSYEGLILLADIHEALEQPKESNAALEKLLRKGGLTADQRAMIVARRSQLEERLLIASLNRR